MAIAGLVVAALGCTSLTSASAESEDKLKHKRNEVNQDIDRAQSALHESSARLVKATNAYRSAKQELSEARDTLSATQGQLTVAKAYDRTMQVRLGEAERDLAEAKADLDAGKDRIRDATAVARQLLIDQANGTDPALRAVSSLLSGEDPSTFGVRMDYSSAVNEAQSASLERVRASTVMLRVRRNRVQEARNRVAEQRAEAARNLEQRRELEKQAAHEAGQVASLVDSTANARSTAEVVKRSDLRKLDSLEDERDRIAGLLQRIAERERREAQEQQQEQEQHQEHRNDGGPSHDHAPDNQGTPSPDPGVSLAYPVANTYITSPYGMRMHPILNVYKLHDGTDFAASCGTPVIAAEDGTVTAAYYNSGYGNRVILNHGYANGVSLATSYNHMTSFVVGEGERVSRGQIIGYAGTTGYSTGCHLHFMVYENGATVDPMTWL